MIVDFLFYNHLTNKDKRQREEAHKAAEVIHRAIERESEESSLSSGEHRKYARGRAYDPERHKHAEEKDDEV